MLAIVVADGALLSWKVSIGHRKEALSSAGATWASLLSCFRFVGFPSYSIGTYMRPSTEEHTGKGIPRSHVLRQHAPKA
jgi:hypothetical protein